MKFYHKRRERPAVPIITLIDILAILLIFFIVTTTFKKKESLVKVNLPKSSEMTSVGEADLRVSLALGKDGSVSLGERIVPMANLSAELLAFRRQNPERELELKADEGAPLGLMVKVWDAATEAGLEIGELPLRILLEE
ncbi:MAG: biopolymer transporter ExbD [Verrucomicrobiales bacterium]|nr:biopolymer transporter ExbD [Verrucomicrobiales bacterium]